MLTASGLQKRFGARRVLRGLDLAVEDGEVVLLQGENGAGKSTLLRILATLDRADSGEAEVDGFPLGDGVEVRSRIGFTGHRPGFYGELSGRENLALWSRLHQLPEHGTNIDATLERVGLKSFSNDRTGIYSRGMLQRLALARAALHRPTTLLLDEPFAALDGDGRELLRTLIAEWRADNRAVLVVAHGSRLVADRTLVLADGVVV
jgi:heme ABC exporter ATP-binding subunit CcmA